MSSTAALTRQSGGVPVFDELVVAVGIEEVGGDPAGLAAVERHRLPAGEDGHASLGEPPIELPKSVYRVLVETVAIVG